MSARILALLVACLAGVTMAFQGTVNAVLGRVAGLLEATFIVHGVGLAVAGALLFGLRLGDGSLLRAAHAPWYAYLGGVLGVLIVYGVVRAIPQVGVAPATTAIILGQVLTAALIDHVGLCGMQKIPFTWHRIAGTLLMAAGAWLLLRGGK
ncbi:MAG: DMT family transporter [Bacillota bacterium]